MKKIILLIIIAMLLIGCNSRYGDLEVEHKKDNIYLTVFEDDWDKLKNIVETAQKNYPEYELSHYVSYYLNNKIIFVFKK